jgi:CHAT domain-containing protein/tetratricopeptide (TPR) repeat protein
MRLEIELHQGFRAPRSTAGYLLSSPSGKKLQNPLPPETLCRFCFSLIFEVTRMIYQSPHSSALKRRRRLGVYQNVVKVLILFPVFSLLPAAALSQDVSTLEPGRSIKRELAGGQLHSYRIRLSADQFLRAVVEQNGIDVVVQVLGPDGKQILEFDSERSLLGEESVILASEGAGEYRLEVRPEQQRAVAGVYEIRIEELRAATENDRVLHEMRKLHNEASALRDAGEYEKALPLFNKVIETRQAISGPDDRDLAATLHDLAVCFYYKGDYPQVEPLSSRALAIQEKTLGKEHPEVASSLNLLANLCFNKGDFAKAEQLSKRALSIKERSVGLENATLAPYLNNLARVYDRRGDYAKAEPLNRRALAIRENSLGPEHPLIAQSLNNLANLIFNKGDDVEAERLHLRALAMREKLLGPDHPNVAESLGNLANIYRKRRDYAQAEPLYRRALAIQEKVGPQRPHVARLLNSLAQFYAVKGDIRQAIQFQSRSNAVTEYNLSLNLGGGSERQKLAFLALFSKQTDFTLSLHSQAAPDDPQALDLAFTTLLRRKSRGLDAMADTIATLRRHATPQDKDLFDRLADARSRLASIKLKPPEDIDPESDPEQLKPLEDEVEKLEVELSARSAGFRAQTKPVTLATVQAALPVGSALVEFVVFTPQEIRSMRSLTPRYLAYLLTPQGPPSWVDLGEAAPIDQIVEAWRQTLRGNRIDVKRLARELDEKIMHPIRSSIRSEVDHLLIAPDGSLNLIPFAALVDEENRYLIERFTISFLTSGRDLLRLQDSPPSQDAPLVVADPLFGKAAPIIAHAYQRSANLSSERKAGKQIETGQTGQTGQTGHIVFRPLPGTKAEALAIKAILPDASLLLQQQATEAALKRARAPRILHIATHGFFLGDQQAQPAEASRGDEAISDMSLGKRFGSAGEPLLRSGLALSGANQSQNEDDDGVLTALEMAGLDLWGTRLVVLSACDTGLGEVKNGEGVQGLRRALVLAGSESQVMSLWPVTDEGAKDLMIDYYKALQRGEGRSEGLRQVQLRMLHSKERRHPFYWAAFIQSGEWANLQGER